MMCRVLNLRYEPISEVAMLFNMLTVVDSIVLPKRPERANPLPHLSSTYRLRSRADHPRPLDPIQRPLVAPGGGRRPP